MNQRSVVLFMPSLLLFGFATYNIVKKRLHAAQPLVLAEAAPTPPSATRGPASFGEASLFPQPSLTERLSLAFAQDLLRSRLHSPKLPNETMSLQKYEERLKRLTAADGYPDQPEIFLSRLCEEGVSEACPLLWNLWQQPGAKEETSPRQTALLLLSCIETGRLCREAIEANRGSDLGTDLTQLSRNYCEGGVKSACEPSPTPETPSNPSRAPASEEPSGFEPAPPATLEPLDFRLVSRRRCEDDNVEDCSRMATLEARGRNLEAAADYADYSCGAGWAEGCLQLAKIQFQKTRRWSATKESLQRFCDEPRAAAANPSLCQDLARGALVNAGFLAHHREILTAEGKPLTGNLPTYFAANW